MDEKGSKRILIVHRFSKEALAKQKLTKSALSISCFARTLSD
jgi:hypothetical protein